MDDNVRLGPVEWSAEAPWKPGAYWMTRVVGAGPFAKTHTFTVETLSLDDSGVLRTEDGYDVAVLTSNYGAQWSEMADLSAIQNADSVAALYDQDSWDA